MRLIDVDEMAEVMTSQLRRLTLAIFLSGSALIVWPLSVAAECAFVPPWPPVTEAIPTARRIVVGEFVTAFDPLELDLPADQAPRDVALRITEVLRGSLKVGSLLDVRYMLPNWPWTASVDGFTYPSCRGLSTPPGDVIVLAIDALHPGGRMRTNSITWFQPPTRYNAVGWVSGTFGAHDRERVTLEEVRRLAALPPTDTGASAPASGGSPLLLVIVAAVAAGLVGVRRLARVEP